MYSPLISAPMCAFVYIIKRSYYRIYTLVVNTTSLYMLQDPLNHRMWIREIKHSFIKVKETIAMTFLFFW